MTGQRGRRRLPEPAVGHVPHADARRAVAAADRPRAVDPVPRGARQHADQPVRRRTKTTATTLPDIMRVMDLQQEQLARSLGEGHRVIHGVAGSGKTMILGYRAEYLAQAPSQAEADPGALLQRAAGREARRGHGGQGPGRPRACAQLPQVVPPAAGGLRAARCRRRARSMFDEMVDSVIRGVERRQIPSGQYQAVLIDEGHDFQPEWLKLVTQMVDPDHQQPAAALRRRAEHLRAQAQQAVQLQERGHPGAGPHDHPEDQLPQHAADPADRQPDRGRPADSRKTTTTTACRCCSPSAAAAKARRR